MKKPTLLICTFLAISMSCSDAALLLQDQSKMKLDLNGLAESQSNARQAVDNPLYFFRSLIKFESDSSSWKEVEKMAKKESKPILFYGWAVWCNPCNHENQSVLSKDAALAQYLNDNFINTRYMMESVAGEHVGTGWEVVDKSRITMTAYPIFLFFDSDGKLVYEYEGTATSADLLAMAQAASLLTNKDKIK